MKCHAGGGVDCYLSQYNSLQKLPDPGSVEINRNISKVMRSMFYFLEFFYSFADAIRSDSISSLSIIDNREM